MNDFPVVAVYHNPPGWPKPSHRWIIEHQGWIPPRGWVPLQGAKPAPAGWVFWTFDGPNAGEYLDPVIGKIRNRALMYGAIAVVGLIISIATLRSPSGGFIFWGAVVFGGYYAIKFALAIPKIKQEMMIEFSVLAARWRQERLRQEYEQYLYENSR